MAPSSKKSKCYCTHAHSSATVEIDREFLCGGCKTVGIGKRSRCDGCGFALHEYCGDCPKTLSLFMHRHPLSRVTQKAAARAAQSGQICDICRDSIEGLFYQCKDCEFYVHPLCTQLPEKLNHALHKVHPLTLQTWPAAGFCAVCRRLCSGWCYRCGLCSFHMHLECILEPVVKYPENGQIDGGIPFRGPPQFASFYGYEYHGGSCMGTSQAGNSMFSLVTKLGFGAASTMVFGVDVSSIYHG